MKLAKSGRNWPNFELPDNRGEVTAQQVLDTEPGDKRDAMIHEWCDSVWKTVKIHQPAIERILVEFDLA